MIIDKKCRNDASNHSKHQKTIMTQKEGLHVPW